MSHNLLNALDRPGPATGQTSEPAPLPDFSHTTALVEHHEVRAGLPVGTHPEHLAAALAACQLHAEHLGIAEADTRPIGVTDGEHAIVGVAWDTVIGYGDTEHEHEWEWTPRWRYWLATLAARNIRAYSESMNLNVDGYEGACADYEDEC